MTDTSMPATEAATEAQALDNEQASYEFAFHVLPTVAEGEVSGVFTDLKTVIENAGGSIFDEEDPQRFDLAYDIVKYVEGKNRKFSSAYFGWIRFKTAPEALPSLTEEIDADQRLLRYLIIRLTRIEEETPFRFHESLAESKVKNVSDREPSDEAAATDEESKGGEGEDDKETEKKEVDDEALNEALKKDEA